MGNFCSSLNLIARPWYYVISPSIQWCMVECFISTDIPRYFIEQQVFRMLRTVVFHFVKYQFQPISCCGNFVETHSSRRVSGDSPKLLRKQYVSTNFLHRENRRNFGILCCVLMIYNGTFEFVNSLY